MDNISAGQVFNFLVVGCLTTLCAAADTQSGARLDFVKPNGWNDGPPKEGEISLITNSGAHLFLTGGGPLTETAMEWAVAELEVLKAEFANKTPLSGQEVQIKECKIITAPKDVSIQGKTWVMLASECGLEKNRQTVRLRTEEYVHKEGDMLIRANVTDETAHFQQLDRQAFEQVLASARITRGSSPRIDLKDSDFAHWKNVEHPVYVSEPFAIAWETPKGWASLNQYHDAQGKPLASLPEGILSVFKKDYSETTPPHGLPASMALQVLEFSDPGKPLIAVLQEEVMNKLTNMEIASPAAKATLGDRAWVTAEVTQHAPFQGEARILKHKLYLTANKDAWQRDILVLVKASAVPEEYPQNITVFDTTVANMKFGKDIAANLMKERLKAIDGSSAVKP